MSLDEHGGHALRLRELGIDTRQEHVIYMRRDCHVCRAEGFEAQARVEVRHGDRTVLATLNVIESDLLSPGEVSLSTSAWRALGAHQNGGGGGKAPRKKDIRFPEFV